MEEERNNPQAFPLGDTECANAQFGMTLRDYFAGQAMTGILSCFRGIDGVDSGKDRAKYAYEVADAMLAAREATP